MHPDGATKVAAYAAVGASYCSGGVGPCVVLPWAQVERPVTLFGAIAAAGGGAQCREGGTLG